MAQHLKMEAENYFETLESPYKSDIIRAQHKAEDCSDDSNQEQRL
jgi:hypothetical protein